MSRPVPSPVIVVYSRPGCHLCEECVATLDAILAERPDGGTPPVVRVVDIETSDDLQRRYLESIPVLRIGQAELPLAVSAEPIRRFLAATLGPGHGVSRGMAADPSRASR